VPHVLEVIIIDSYFRYIKYSQSILLWLYFFSILILMMVKSISLLTLLFFGTGVQELIVNCVRESDGQVVSPFLCPLETRPVVLTRTCNDVPCPPRWNYSDFQPCSKPCGIGIQLRDVSCIHEVTRGGGNTVVVPNSMCPQPPPPDRQYCNVLDCPVKWHAAEWTKVKF
jgi:hypothetical protein